MLMNIEKQVLGKLKTVLNEFLGDSAKIILYGSKARGDDTPSSDIDLAIIVKGLTRELKNKILDNVADVELEYLTPLSTFVISETDFEFLKKRERRIALDIENEGILL